MYQPKRRAVVSMSNPKNYATHAWHNSIDVCWADPVVYLLLLKSSIVGWYDVTSFAVTSFVASSFVHLSLPGLYRLINEASRW